MPLTQRNVPFAALMVSFLTDWESSKTYLSITTDEPQPTASFVPSRNTNWPSPDGDVLMRSLRWTLVSTSIGPLCPVTCVLMTTAWPTGSAAITGHAPLNAMQSVATDTERQPHMIHVPRNTGLINILVIACLLTLLG